MVNGREPRAWRKNTRRALLTACSTASTAWGCAPAALAQVAPASAPPQARETPAPASPAPPDNRNPRASDIVVIGNRAIIVSLQDLPVERTYSEDDVESYDAGTVGEVLDQIRNENGDAEPSLLVNGQPVADPGDIADLPAEAISRIEALPRGAAQRIGGPPGQRAYNVVLKRQLKSATFTGSEELATEGGWNNTRGESLLTYIKGQDRVNLTVRGADSGKLLESERDFIPNPETFPYSPIGNIIPASGTEVDPALSAAVGQPVTVVALPPGNTTPTQAQLVAGSNHVNPSNQSFYRTLRGSSRPVDVAVAGNKVLAPWLSLSFNGRLNWSRGESFSGLPSARFLIPASNPDTPFTTPVYLALNDPSRPLRSISKGNSQSLSTTFNASFGAWRASVAGRWDRRERDYTSQSTGSLAGLSTVADATNPFAGSLAALIPVTSRLSTSRNTTAQFTADADGPLFTAWAGRVTGRAGVAAGWVNYDATDISGARSFKRHEYSAKAGVTVPLTSTGEDGFLPVMGDSELAFDIGRADLGRFGTLDRRSLAFNWQLVPWLRFVASTQRDEQAIQPELLAAPVVTTPNVPYFDPLTGETVDVTLVYGGAGSLQNQNLHSRTLSWTATPLPKYRLQLSVDYLFSDLRNQIGGLPPPSSAIVAAFPGRFQRDASGTLVLVDTRSVNFARQRNGQLRFGGGFTIPLSQAVMLPADRKAGTRARRVPPWELQVHGSYTILLHNTLLIRQGLPEVDLLAGGATGVAGGQQRRTWNFDLALAKGGTGVRLAAQNRGVRYLVTGTLAAPDLLTFHPTTTVDLKAFANLGQLFPASKWARDTRVTLAFDNLLNDRQRVADSSGAMPQAYQPVRLDPVGRTVMLEIRKVF